MTLVTVLIGTISTILFIAILALFPTEALQEARKEQEPERLFHWHTLAAVVAGVLSFLFAWGILSHVSPENTMATHEAQRALSAHAKDIVTVILSDFRGLDTMGELTVIGIALLGIAKLLEWKKK